MGTNSKVRIWKLPFVSNNNYFILIQVAGDNSKVGMWQQSFVKDKKLFIIAIDKWWSFR